MIVIDILFCFNDLFLFILSCWINFVIQGFDMGGFYEKVRTTYINEGLFVCVCVHSRKPFPVVSVRTEVCQT